MEKTAIVYVHGHMGSIRQFAPLIDISSKLERIEQVNVSLPGHDGTINDFINSNRYVWQEYVSRQVEQLTKTYDSLILVGHSMGGPLLINAAISSPEKIKAIIAIALPLYIHITYRSIATRLQCIGKAERKQDDRVSAAREMNGVSGVTIANSYKLIPNTLGLIQIMAETRRSLCKLAIPLTIINSVNDEIVSMKTVRFAQKALPNAAIVVLEQASHFWFPPQEAQIIKQRIEMKCAQENSSAPTQSNLPGGDSSAIPFYQ